jgi:hypothetical protein
MSAIETCIAFLSYNENDLVELVQIRNRIKELEKLVDSQYPDKDWEDTHLELEAKLSDRIKELEADQEAYDVVHKNDVAVIDRQCLELEKYQWQPIETAPDETEILILDDEVYQAHWDKEELLWYCEGADMYLLPTHWMPLPEPPK